MNRSAKVATWSAATLIVAGLAVGVGYTVVTATSTIPHTPTQEASMSARSAAPTPEPTAVLPKTEQERVGAAENCHPLAQIQISGEVDGNGNLIEHAELRAEPIDFGPREGANGIVNLNDQGKIVSYTTVNGDNLDSIETRLCTDMNTVATYNGVGYAPGQHTWKVGETFVIRPDPNVPWVDPVKQWHAEHPNG
ncbi:hypothetical protein [Microbacterium sp.]|jgi:hypothetical protein|uniref:hypothetical protein n=1 Tax=Microbacterium sp. TaxID=51671 RepID=UPI001AC2A265|nr:hypothetical protein [Microbacterium sp.]MBN9158400.1 hypothetical protein [Microbacterium sp.]